MPQPAAIESGDRSHALQPVESVAQISVLLQDTDPTLDPALAASARTAAGEGVVLLRNEGVLPLPAADAGAVAVFGRVQIDWFAVGYGSGGDVKVPYVWNLVAGLRDAGVAVDEELATVYREWSAANRPSLDGTWGTWPHHFAEMPLDPALAVAAATRADTAVVVIGRAAGEARESILEPGSYYLTGDERAMLDAVTAAFEKVAVVLDAGNVMDLGWLEEYGDRIGAVLYAWQGGMEGGRAVAGVLAGETAPSGRLTDTIARSYADYPSAPNFGDPLVGVYAEDVFVGYRYFETFAPERVLFPFGFGLGYTTFAIDVVEQTTDAGVFRAVVEVRNTGAVHAGKEVVQVYVGAPVDARLSQPVKRLAAFAKTGELAPGQSQRLELTFDLADFASYDDSGVTGHRSAYVLEPGEYPVFLGTDVRRATQVAAFDVAELQVVRQLTEASAASPLVPFDRMIVTRGADGRAVVGWEAVPTATVDRATRVLAELPAELEPTGYRGIRLDDVASGAATLDAFVAQLSDAELALLARGDVTMHSPLGAPGNAGVLGGVSPSLRDKGVRPITTTDGPSGIRLAAYASLLPSGTALASTWNPALVQELAALHGQEMVRKGSDVLLSPGMNIHRDPLCGRNFEYFSEDPLVTGRIGGAVVRGVQSAGVSACPKHFAANNQETNRTRHDSRVSERALREIYLRGFELCVREAAPRAIMTSYNKINGVWAHYNYDLVTVILRGEWGYQGAVMTDWWMEDAVDPDFPALSDNAYRVRAQVDVLMPGGVKTDAGPQAYADDTILESLARDGGLTRGELQRGARNVLGLVLALAPVVDARG
ncbi:MAG: beta-glucosidase [Microbacterium sp. SCN 70-200]|uniref:beta-glucosidase n=1 Tax=unclassified Microbacterium TaxID=2609290 RepID=UPI00086DF2D1|nr:MULTISPECIES: glycoside hydrolase family 3 C-terminal domain-containing protein [unclassified Microbacterium]MBN9215092.1 glycoside hydrolase family 3 C-terminal domain-containing protein [Microbacterium sp.]ODT42829.1 MAG: beta-glucosidase [Microbacterium sp. SCN 70-200]OJV84864.1 MAG: beta-glucosidase [Microbacterium sp. 70-16]